MTEIPSDAEICPTCGCPINVMNTNTHQDTLKLFKQFTCKWWFWGIIVLIFLLIAALSGDSNSTERAKENTIQSSDANSSQEIHSNKSAVDFYKWLDKNDSSMDYTIPDKALTFIEDHPEFFPGNDNNTGAMSDFVDYEISYQHIAKNPAKYNDKLISISGTISDCSEIESEYGTITFLQIIDDYTENSYCLYYWGCLENTFENNYTWGYALPFDVTTFENIGGFYTEAVVGAACYIYESTTEEYNNDYY